MEGADQVTAAAIGSGVFGQQFGSSPLGDKGPERLAEFAVLGVPAEIQGLDLLGQRTEIQEGKTFIHALDLGAHFKI